MPAGPKVKCRKCRNIIQSQHRHDFVWCPCGAIAIDGGNAYTRLVGNAEDILEVDDLGVILGPVGPAQDSSEAEQVEDSKAAEEAEACDHCGRQDAEAGESHCGPCGLYLQACDDFNDDRDSRDAEMETD